MWKVKFNHGTFLNINYKIYTDFVTSSFCNMYLWYFYDLNEKKMYSPKGSIGCDSQYTLGQ